MTSYVSFRVFVFPGVIWCADFEFDIRLPFICVEIVSLEPKTLSEASKPISSPLVEQAKAEHIRRRRCLIKEVESLTYLLRQHLPIRRRIETEGYLHQLFMLRKKDVPDLHLWDEYLSPVVQNEIIKASELRCCAKS